MYVKEFNDLYLKTLFGYIGSKITTLEKTLAKVQLYDLCFTRFLEMQENNYYLLVQGGLKIFEHMASATDKANYMPRTIVKEFERWMQRQENLKLIQINS